MDWNCYIFVGVACLMVLIVGLILLLVHHALKKQRDRRLIKCVGLVGKDLIQKNKQAMVDVLCESMDILPEKINEVKRTIDEEGFK